MKIRRGCLLLIGIPLICALVGVISIYLIIVNRDNNYADYSHFQTSIELKQHLENELQVSIATLDQVRSFAAQNMKNCGEFSEPPSISNDSSFSSLKIECRVLAPRGEFMGINFADDLYKRLIIQLFYDISFTFADNILTGIEVSKGDLSL